ncbi:MAG TPA: shikimate dehydrogenase [Candidatus Omnitrophica bacterium]|nr:shikimate dehydrogenase [Candidatus Omnitrophota bacterium]
MGQPSQKQLYGLIGFPVSHSYSAFMHNAAFAHYGIDAEYRLFEVRPDSLDDFFKKTIFHEHLQGFNITVPHKEHAVAFLNASVSPTVRMNQAVNTVRVEPDGSLSGVNTDGAGFAMDLKERGFDVAGKKVSMIGAGGGAKAVAASIALARPSRFLIFDIDDQKAGDLCRTIKKFFVECCVESVDSVGQLGVSDADLLINATPVGMKDSDPMPVKSEWLHKGLFVYDLIYNPAETKLLKAAAHAGCRVANGLGMLLYQGALAFEYWTGRNAPLDVMRRALMEEAERRAHA